MTQRTRRLLSCLAVSAAACAWAATASAKSEWKNGAGESFTAEPSELLGPWALFDDGTFVPLTALSKEDSIRFYEGLKAAPARAADWKDAKSPVSAELYGRLLHYSGNDIVKDNEAGRPEPQFYIIFFVSNDGNQSWNELQRSTPALYAKIVKAHPDLIQGVVFGDGAAYVIGDHFDIAVHTHGDWMYTDFPTQIQMLTLSHMTPTNYYGIVVVTRNGVPLFGPDSATDEQVISTFDKFSSLLDHMRPSDPKVWVARLHYFLAVQPVAFATGHSDPLLMGNPLAASTLRKMKIYKVDATFQVGADGTITGVDVAPNGMAPGTVKMFTDGFQRNCLFVPAVDNGKFVAGTYTYHMDVAP
jgi:hypothetical protein